ncbi:hypothetical protein COU01_02690 [Candidatus Falkowbacteria bacterium CG10_big_fil_rev_8_21_14_0_10_44_15]|uniref:Right handed beta helix domain-containing protein n=1 Tax=Candidatus Falkowbacteria bacterium CG10_big_fil_rev_8_21_14_0_10_44_15 TaxID=1974569 RepID=A0A2H0UZJ6_9BACT|nr:MAG: hypothetical protein COU01_02690 [Candidatus Falkowbacteria bacterium CG10_big_fil_rev_8_21_14_0_10_44_15]
MKGPPIITAVAVALFLFLPCFASAATLNVPGTYATIQAAVDASAPSDIIDVAAGTYDEQITIVGAKSSLTFTGAGVGSTIVRPTSVLADGEYDVQIYASGTMFSGFTFDFDDTGSRLGSDFKTGLVIGETGDGVHPEIVIENVNISNCEIIPADSGVGIIIGKDRDVSGLVINGNAITGDPNNDGLASGIYINPTILNDPGGSNITVPVISGNTINGHLDYGIAVESGDFTVSGNTISNTIGAASRHGIRYTDWYDLTHANVTITRNTISAMVNGIDVRSGSGLGSLAGSITENSVSSCTIGFSAGTGANVTVSKNSINGTNTQLVENTSASTLDASNNWLGSADETVVITKLVNPSTIDFTPIVESGVDSDGVTVGFQPNRTLLRVHLLGAQAGVVIRGQEGIALIQ